MSAALATWLFAATWKGTLLLASVLLLHRVARNRMPSRWLCALLVVALVRLLAPVTPAASFSIFNLVPASVTGAPVMIVTDDGRPPVRAFARTALPLAVHSARTPWIPALLAMWAAGAGFMLARTGRQIFRFHRQLADRVDVVRDDVTTLLDECRMQLGVRRRIRIASTSAVAAPSLHGWLRPVLLLPHGFLSSFTREQLRYVVLHELAHLRRSDVLINWIATAAKVLHWFNPLVWLAMSRLAEERELACDALALEALGAAERPAYGGTVLEIADRMRTTSLVPALVGMTATPQQLKRRIVMIASFRRQSRHSLPFAAMVVAVGLVTLTDASAGEKMHVRKMVNHGENMSPATRIIVESLEAPISLELTSVPLEDVLRAVTTATGTSIRLAEGALTDVARQSHVTVKGANVPAHLVLFETLAAFKLAVKFTDAGVDVVPQPEDGDVQRIRISHATPEGDGTGERVIIRHEGDPLGELPSSDRIVIRKKIVDVATEPSADGSAKRKVTFKKDGVEGTLEIEVKP